MTAWSKFQGDFNAMTDAEIEVVTLEEQAKVDEAEEWFEAVAAWKSAGKPRAALSRASDTREGE